MIKTDKVIYRTKTQEEYDWLMEKLEAVGCKWAYGNLPTEVNSWGRYSTETCINLEDETITFEAFVFFKSDSEYKDYDFIEVSDLMKRTINIDKVIYHTKTQDEYDWLMDRLEEAGCERQGGGSPICGKEVCDSTKSDSYIRVGNETISFLDEDYLYEYTDLLDYKFIEVSDLIGDEEEPQILDKLEDLLEDMKHIENEFKTLVGEEEETESEEEKDTREKLEAINKQIISQIEDLKKHGKEQQKIKKFVYTIEVYFD